MFKSSLFPLLFQSFVPEAGKDGKYWEKREKNNVAARRSREARRLKENQIALRTAYLEKAVCKGIWFSFRGQASRLRLEATLLFSYFSQYLLSLPASQTNYFLIFSTN